MLKALFQTFLQERRFLRNCAQTTIRSYGQAWDAFEPVLAPVKTSDEIRAAVKTGVIQMMNEGRLSPQSQSAKPSDPKRRFLVPYANSGNLEYVAEAPTKQVRGRFDMTSHPDKANARFCCRENAAKHQ